jgi:hypothetical protein
MMLFFDSMMDLTELIFPCFEVTEDIALLNFLLLTFVLFGLDDI